MEHLEGGEVGAEEGDPFALIIAGYCDQATRAPRDARGHFQFGRQFYQVEMFDWAVRAFTSALEIAPRWADAQFYLASSLRGAGRIEEANREYERAKELDPKMIEARFESELLKRNKKKAAET